MQTNNGAVSDATRFDLAKKAFSHTAAYDSAISNYLTAINADGSNSAFPAQINFNFAKVQDMRYGENPHQQAAFYRDLDPVAGGIAGYTQLQGKELSYNNIGDADAAWELVKTFDQPACVIVKHANPCGVAIADSAHSAYKLAYATDPDLRIRRHHRLQPRAGCRQRGGDHRQPVRRTHHRAFRKRGGAQGHGSQTERARAHRAAVQRAQPVRLQARQRRPAGADAGCAQCAGIPTEGSDQGTARQGAAARPAVRLARGEIREVERHRVLQGTARRWASARGR